MKIDTVVESKIDKERFFYYRDTLAIFNNNLSLRCSPISIPILPSVDISRVWKEEERKWIRIDDEIPSNWSSCARNRAQLVDKALTNRPGPLCRKNRRKRRSPSRSTMRVASRSAPILHTFDRSSRIYLYSVERPHLVPLTVSRS